MSPTRAKHIALSNFISGVPKDPLELETGLDIDFFRDYISRPNDYPVRVMIQERGNIYNLSGDLVEERSGLQVSTEPVPFIGY